MSTSSEITIVKTTLPIPETTILTLMTTISQVKITNVPTNVQQITSNLFKVESSVIDTTIIQNIKTTVRDIDIIEKTEANLFEQTTPTFQVNEKTEILKKADFPIESLCENNKIFFEGKCICNTEKGYYSLNFKSSKKCDKSCETCSKGGIYNENN